MSLLSLVALFRFFGCSFLCYIHLKIVAGDNDPCHVWQCVLAMVLAIFRRNFEEFRCVTLYVGILQMIFEHCRQISE